MTFHLFGMLVSVNTPSVCLLSKIWFRTFHPDLERETCSLGKKMYLWAAAPASFQEFITLRGKLNSLLIEKTEVLLHLAAHYY